MSDSLLLAAILSVSGGLQDAYTYMGRVKVFANAQTGNIVLLAANFYEQNWGMVRHYLLPLTAFALGVAVAELIRRRGVRYGPFHWRQVVALLEMGLLFLAGFFPAGLDGVANALVSFSCAMQVQAFRKVDGYAYASTMCIGNLRSGVEALCVFGWTKDGKFLAKAGHYFGIIVLFALGAVMGVRGLAFLGLRAVWLCCVLMGVVFLLMFIEEEGESV